MNSQSIAGILGAIVASIVLVVAIAYGPIGQFGKPVKPASVQPAQARNRHKQRQRPGAR